MPQPSQLTLILDEVSGGDPGAFSRLIEAVYSDLHNMAAGRLRRSPAPDTIGPTELVNETVLRLIEQREKWKNREHFFAIATRLMLRVVIDRQRKRLSLKRGADIRLEPLERADDERVQLQTLTSLEEAPSEPLRIGLTLAEFLDTNPRAAEVVTLHVVADIPLPRVAEFLGVSVATVERDWRAAKQYIIGKLNLNAS